MLLTQGKKPAEDRPPFPKKLLEKEPAELAASGKAEEIHAYYQANPGKAEPRVQDTLASRFYSDAHWRANARLIGPILSSAAFCAIANEFTKAAGRLYPTIAFACSIFVSSLIGLRLSISFERTLSQKIPDIFAAGGAAAGQAQDDYACVVIESQDAPSAHALLGGGLVTSTRAQGFLAETIRSHGTKEQAASLLGKGISGLAGSALRMKAGEKDIGI